MDPADLAALSADPLPYVDHPDAGVRRLAVSALSHGATEPEAKGALRRLLADDPEPRVRAEAAEVLGGLGPEMFDELIAATSDPEAIVVEAVATALGEVGDTAGVPWLIDAARSHDDRLVREAAVAALGAIGDEAAVPLLLELVAKAPPQVRRRTVAALTVFDGPEIEKALRKALDDRNPMVREAAEMVVGRPFGQ